MWNLRVKGHESKRGTIMDVEGKKGEGGKYSVTEGISRIKVYYMHVWKYHIKAFTLYS
jgi:hypothetical protein